MSGWKESNKSWEHWVTYAIGGLQADQKNLHQRTEDNRQAAFRDLWHVRRELLGKIAYSEPRRKSAPEWIKHVPWVKVTLLMIAALLILTGHMTVADIKPWLLRKIGEF